MRLIFESNGLSLEQSEAGTLVIQKIHFIFIDDKIFIRYNRKQLITYRNSYQEWQRD
ncbi:hypothetical protein [Gracilibacillus dipsosauri]|uniref:hypothetical protein n=1 Tax=Gracilibacillus dipsosauri TaxID=178340 RepID=UPI0024099A12